MNNFVKMNIKRVKLAVLWVRRILFAPNHYKVGFVTKLRMNIFGGYLSDQYVQYDFRNNDRRLYLSEFDWYRSRWINEPFDAMLNNKVICAEVLDQYANVAKSLFMKNKGKMVSLEPAFCEGFKSPKDVIELLHRYEFVFMKPLAAGKGKDVHRLELIDSLPAVDGQTMAVKDFSSFLDSSDGWFLSEGIKQHDFLDSIYDKTTNTIRLITLRDPESGNYKIFFAVQRIGTSQTIPVDNGSKGGLIAKIDLDTGVLSEARGLRSLDCYETHPDSGFQIKGAVIPNWESIQTEMLSLARKLPFINFIAWDILLTQQGVCIIEANTSSGVNIIQIWGPQRNGELGEFYRAHGAIK